MILSSNSFAIISWIYRTICKLNQLSKSANTIINMNCGAGEVILVDLFPMVSALYLKRSHSAYSAPSCTVTASTVIPTQQAPLALQDRSTGNSDILNIGISQKQNPMRNSRPDPTCAQLSDNGRPTEYQAVKSVQPKGWSGSSPAPSKLRQDL